jgi:hypothetical protein
MPQPPHDRSLQEECLAPRAAPGMLGSAAIGTAQQSARRYRWERERPRGASIPDNSGLSKPEIEEGLGGMVLHMACNYRLHWTLLRTLLWALLWPLHSMGGV